MTGQCGDDILRRAVGQTAEDELHVGEIDGINGDEVGQEAAGEMREDGADRLAGVTVGGERDDLDAVVAGQEAQQLGASIATGAEDGDLDAMFAGFHCLLPISCSTQKGAPQDGPLMRRFSCPDQRLENWKLRRAFALPYFLRSTTRLSRVR